MPAAAPETSTEKPAKKRTEKPAKKRDEKGGEKTQQQKKRPRQTFTIKCGTPVEDKIMDIGQFVRRGRSVAPVGSATHGTRLLRVAPQGAG